MNKTICITGIGTGVGKTLVSAIITQALPADYWKPIQAGVGSGTDAGLVKDLISNNSTVIHPESYQLKLPASPHIAARDENIRININAILEDYNLIRTKNENLLIVEGAGGVLVPLNEKETMLDLFKALQAGVIIVSRNYLGSINHSLLTARVLKSAGIDVLGWIFNDHFMQYENEIAGWTNIPVIATVPYISTPDKQFISEQARRIRPTLESYIYNRAVG